MSTQRTLQADFIETETGTITLPQNFTGTLSAPITGISTIDFGAGSKQAELIVTGITPIISTSNISAFLRVEATANHTTDDIIVDPVIVLTKDIVVGVGFTIVCIMPQGKGFGQYKIGWTIN